MTPYHSVQVGVVGEAVLRSEVRQTARAILQLGEHRAYPQLVAVDPWRGAGNPVEDSTEVGW